MLRNLMLKIADSPAMVGFLSRQGMRTGFAKRFIAGDNSADAVAAIEDLNAQGICASLDLLGEGVTEAGEAERATQAYIELLDLIRQHRIDSNISIKLTQLGLDIGRDFCSQNLRRILERAREFENFVRIDMEGSAYTHDTVELFEEHFKEFGPRQVGIVIQAYLYRSRDDIERLSGLGCNIRLCKGAYKEPPEVAFPKKSDVDENFTRLLEVLLSSPAYTAIASHDPRMIDHGQEFIRAQKVPDSRYEFQMLYGVRRALQLSLKEQGCKMRVYVPFGTQWAPYFIRRLAERPANMLFVLKNLVRT